MKKFCSSCGNQLELSKRTCSECGAANPFFIPNFTLLEDYSNELGRLRIEKEKLDKELATKEAAQAEFERQEQLKRELIELERQKVETIEKERQLREALEHSPESALKNELQKVKQETEQYKKETIHLLNQIREELKQKIEDETRRTKPSVVEPIQPTRREPIPVAKAEQKPQQPARPSTVYPPANTQKTIGTNMIMVLVFLFVVGVGGASIYLYFNKPADRPKELALPTIQQYETSTPGVETTPTKDTTKETPTDTIKAAMPTNNELAMVNTKPSLKEAVDEPAKAPRFELTVTRAMNDLIGRKLSGCNITIGSVSEINNISHPVLIEKVGSSGYLKFKVNLKVVQNKETYTSSPYIYYTSDGRFLKIDGTNCE